jgi:urease accessory protein
MELMTSFFERSRDLFAAPRGPALAAALAAIVALAGTSPADAHLLNASGAGWSQGFAHPFSGLDHILAMVAVGIWAAQNGRPALWLLPIAFPLAMIAGGLLALAGVPVPGVETGIAASVAVLGLMIALAARPPLPLAVALVGLFALFHGHAHGTELPEAASPVLYGLGFVLATAILHAIGLGIGYVIRQPLGARAVRVGGAAIALAGVGLFIGL